MIEKFETGEVGHMAFGFKVRKVNMMRGNRQGNNAFTEDPTHKAQTPLEYLMDGMSVEYVFRGDTVEEDTFKALQEGLKADKFREFVNKILPALMKLGCLKAMKVLFDLIGD